MTHFQKNEIMEIQFQISIELPGLIEANLTYLTEAILKSRFLYYILRFHGQKWEVDIRNEIKK